MSKKKPRYAQVYRFLKSKMEDGSFPVGSLLPSENDLCQKFSVTRTTVRTALGMLENEGLIERSQGKPARVRSRQQSLGLLTVKGFSEAAGTRVETRMLQQPELSAWPGDLPFIVHASEKPHPPVFFSRIRLIGGEPVMWESNWFASGILEKIREKKFTDGSFFKTLSAHYGIGIVGSEQELHALVADDGLAELLQLQPGYPLLQIYIRFTTSLPGFYIYSRLLCNTDTYKIGNTYSL
jgi:GntR family transcriptional regulator/GntR family frlABCD operon transcriptional regulator